MIRRSPYAEVIAEVVAIIIAIFKSRTAAAGCFWCSIHSLLATASVAPCDQRRCRSCFAFATLFELAAQWRHKRSASR